MKTAVKSLGLGFALFSAVASASEYLFVKIDSVKYHSSVGMVSNQIVGKYALGFRDKKDGVISDRDVSLSVGDTTKVDSLVGTKVEDFDKGWKFAVAVDGSYIREGVKWYASLRGLKLSPEIVFVINPKDCAHNAFSSFSAKNTNLEVHYSCSVTSL